MTNPYPSFDERIESIRKTKLEFNDRKIIGWGYYDNDDQGWIPWESIDFEPETDPESGLCTGPSVIGKSFRKWLKVHPVYIHERSAVAGAWIGQLPGVEWKDRPEGFEERWEKYNIRVPGITAMNHFGPDMKIGLDLGFQGLLEKVRYFRALNNPDDSAFYDGEEDVVLGMLEFIERHSEYAEQMADRTQDPFEKENYREIAKINRNLLINPPRTLREAVQFLAWFQTFDRIYFLGGAMQQIDVLLLPYYEADRKAGRITSDDEVVWFFVSLLFNDTHYHQIGGPSHIDGHDVSNELSFAMLDAMHKLQIPVNVAVRIHDGIDQDLMDRAVRYLFEDGTGVSFSCSKGLNDGFVRNGFHRGTAILRAKVGCNWTALPGIEYCLQDVNRVCLVAPFLIAFYEMVDDPMIENSLDELWTRYIRHLEASVMTLKEGFDWHVDHKMDNVPELVLNLFCHGPIERGLDVSAGGVDIYNFNIDGVGLATVADSFAAIEQRVVIEKRLDWEDLAECLRSDYTDQEYVRLMLKNIPRYGSGGSLADKWARRISQKYAMIVKDSPTPKHHLNVIPGMFSHGTVHMLGENLGATPNGRFSGAEISHSADPDPGFLRGGGNSSDSKE